MEMDYYAYEYSVIRRLMDIFKIKSVDCNKETEYIRGQVRDEKDNKLKNKILLEIVSYDCIQFNFKQNWSYCLSKKEILDAFNDNIDIEDVVNIIKKEIEYEWLKEIKEEV